MGNCGLVIWGLQDVDVQFQWIYVLFYFRKRKDCVYNDVLGCCCFTFNIFYIVTCTEPQNCHTCPFEICVSMLRDEQGLFFVTFITDSLCLLSCLFPGRD